MARMPSPRAQLAADRKWARMLAARKLIDSCPDGCRLSTMTGRRGRRSPALVHFRSADRLAYLMPRTYAIEQQPDGSRKIRNIKKTRKATVL